PRNTRQCWSTPSGARCARCGRQFRPGWRSADGSAGARSHSKDPVLSGAAALLPGHRQCETQGAPRVEWIEDAIVPEPRGRVIRPPLPLELLADRRLQLLLFGIAE